MDEITFIVKSRTKRETDEGTEYRVNLASEDGHKLTLKSTSEILFDGYSPGESITVKISNPQTTLS